MQRAILRTTVFAIALMAMASLAVADVPQLINYQGRLTDAAGDPVPDFDYPITFTIYDAATDGNTLWTNGQQTVPVVNGLFHYQLGSAVLLPDTLFEDTLRWLGIKVGADPEVTPRVRLKTVPYAYHALRADTADFALSGPNGGGNWSVSDSVLYTNKFWGIARGGAGNVLYGDNAHTMVNIGVACTTGTSGENYSYSTVSGGKNNKSGNFYSTVDGGINNTASGWASTIGGGSANVASGYGSTIAGGSANTASEEWCTIGGGLDNTATEYYSTVGGGFMNSNAGACSVIPGGCLDTLTAGADYSMAFGVNVYISSPYSVIFFDADSSGRFGLNRDDHDGGVSHPIHVGTDGTNGNGAHLTVGGVWTDASSREFKEKFETLDGEDVLKRINELPMEGWEYKGTGERHIWPCAEDFHESFDVGVLKEDGTRDTKYLAAGDIAGVALVGVQELYRMVKDQHQMAQELQAKTREIEELRTEMAQLQALVETILAQQRNSNSGSDELAITK